MDFKCIHINKELTIIKLSANKLDTKNAPDLKSNLVLLGNQGFRHIILDVSNCHQIDSSGLNAILIASRICEDANGCFVLTGLQSEVTRLVRLSMFHTFLEITDTMDEACQLVERKEQFQF